MRTRAVIAYGSGLREWAVRVQHGGLRVGGAPLASREPGRQCEERSGGRDNGEQQRARAAASACRWTGQGPGWAGAAVRYDLQNGDGLRVQCTRPGQRGWTVAEHQRPVVRPVAARQRGATAGCRRKGRRPQGRSYLGSVSRRIGPFHPRSRSAPLSEPSGSHDSDGRCLDENAMRFPRDSDYENILCQIARWNSNWSNSRLKPKNQTRDASAALVLIRFRVLE